MKQTTKDLAEILSKRNKEGKYNAIIERAANNGYHDHKFEKVENHPEYGECICPKIELVKDLAPFPELSDIRQDVINGKYDEPADEEDAEEIRTFLLQDQAPDVFFEKLGFEVPTKEEREKYARRDTPKNIVTKPTPDLNDITLGIIIKGEVKEFNFIANIGKDQIDAIIQNWAVRTKEHTTQSLVDYINSKSAHGFYAEVKE